MADTVVDLTLRDGSKYVITKHTCLSDGTGESTPVKKVDVSGLSPVPVTVTIEEIWYSVWGMNVTLYWDASSPVRILELQGQGYMDLRHIGGLTDTKASGYTGDIKIGTVGYTSGDSYSIILKMRKNY